MGRPTGPGPWPPWLGPLLSARGDRQACLKSVVKYDMTWHIQEQHVSSEIPHVTNSCVYYNDHQFVQVMENWTRTQ